jgi:hypothetical protein
VLVATAGLATGINASPILTAECGVNRPTFFFSYTTKAVLYAYIQVRELPDIVVKNLLSAPESARRWKDS